MPLIILYLASRGWQLLHLPPFVDELLYIRWTEAIAISIRNVWLPIVEDGQPPLFFWLGAIIKWTTHLDTLLILRCLSIAFGLLTLLVLIKLGTKLFSRQMGLILGFIYTLFPMYLWYDRLGMRESLVTLAGLLVIYGLVNRLVYQISSGSYLVLLGFALGIMTKGTAILFLPVIATCFVVWHKRLKLTRTDALVGSALVIICLALYYGAHNVVAKGETFLLSLADIRSRIYPNLYSTLRWIIEYSTIPIVALGLFGSTKLYFAKHKALPIYLIVLCVTMGIEIITASIYFPRYFLWTLLVWMIPIAYGASWILKQRFGRLVLALLFLPVIVFDYQIIVGDLAVPLPAIERWQYITGWPSGYGIREMSAEVNSRHVDVLVTEVGEVCKTGIGYYGANGFTQLLTTDHDQINQQVREGRAVYLCLNIAGSPAWDGEAPLVSTISRPGGESSLRLYQLKGSYAKE